MEHTHKNKQKSGKILNLTVDSGVTHTHARHAFEKCWFGQGFGEQCFFFQNKIKYFFDTFSQKIFCQVIKINNFRGELTNISDKKETLLVRQSAQFSFVGTNSKRLAIRLASTHCLKPAINCFYIHRLLGAAAFFQQPHS